MEHTVNPKKLFGREETERIAASVAEAEKTTSAEIKVVVLGHSWQDIRDTAARVFRRHGLHNTRERNAVLILLVLANHEFLVYGDEGVHKHVRQAFWDDVRDAIASRLAQGRFCEGLCEGVRLIGDRLRRHFPPIENQPNTIPNEPILDH